MYDSIRDQLIRSVPFAGHLSITLTDLGPGHAVAILPEAPELLNHVGTQHAAALFAVAETASGGAVAGLFGPEILSLRPVTTEGSVRYARPAKGPITATAETDGTADDLRAALERDGRARFTVAVRLADAQEREVASATFEWHVSRPR